MTSDNIMTSLLKKLSISIKIHTVKPPRSVFKLSTESVGSRRRREPVANCVHTADVDATQLDSCVASAVCIEHVAGRRIRESDHNFSRPPSPVMVLRGRGIYTLRCASRRRRVGPSLAARCSVVFRSRPTGSVTT